MRRDYLSKVVAFVVGAAIGSAITWKLMKTKYEEGYWEEEIESDDEEETELEEDPETPEVNHKQELEHLVDTLGYKEYSSHSKKEEKEEEDMDKPFIISPEEFGELDDYEAESLTYYADGVLTDDWNEVIEDADEIVGEDFAEHFGEYEDDSVFVRNPELKTDYEILLDVRKFSDVETSSNNVEE